MPTNSPYLQIQASNGGQALVLGGASTIPFTQTIASAPGISFDPITSIITINEPGVYFADWFVAVNTTTAIAARFALISGGSLIQGNSAAKPDQVIGTGIIPVTAPGTTLELMSLTPQQVTTQAVPVIANLTIFKLDENSTADAGTMITFSNGMVDWANPLTWPITALILELPNFGDIESVLDVLQLIQKSLVGGLVSTVVNPILGVFQMPGTNDPLTLDGLIGFLLDFNDRMGSLAAFDAFVGDANMGLVPRVLGADAPLLNLVAGPPYAINLSHGGKIHRFAAEYDTLLSVNLSIAFSVIDFLQVYNLLAKFFNSIKNTLVNAVQSAIPLIPIPGLPDLPVFDNTETEGSIDLFATLWHQPASPCPAGVQADGWISVAEVNLGSINLAELAALEQLPDMGSAVGGMIGTLLGGKTDDLSAANFRSCLTDNIDYQVNPGDYLVVSFGLRDSAGFTIGAAVAAPNASASVTLI